MRTKRIEGFGKGKEINFPTINIQIPLGSVELGLWAVLTNFGTALGLFSNYGGMVRGEIHVLSQFKNTLELLPENEFDLEFIKKLRDPIKMVDIQSVIIEDKKLANDFWKGVKTCRGCSRGYQQDCGYSNYTVERTDYGCYADVWLTDDYDNFDRVLKYQAINCQFFEEGEMWELDVDGELPGPSKEWLLSLKRDIKLTTLLDGDK